MDGGRVRDQAGQIGTRRRAARPASIAHLGAAMACAAALLTPWTGAAHRSAIGLAATIRAAAVAPAGWASLAMGVVVAGPALALGSVGLAVAGHRRAGGAVLGGAGVGAAVAGGAALSHPAMAGRAGPVAALAAAGLAIAAGLSVARDGRVRLPGLESTPARMTLPHEPSPYLHDGRTPPPRRPPTPRRSDPVIWSVALAVLGLLAGGALASRAVAHARAGSPSAAVTRLVAAVNRGDGLGALAAIEPAERDAIAGPGGRFLAGLRKTEVMGPTADLRHLGGVKLSLGRFRITDQELAPGIVAVHLISARATADFNPDAFPLGPLVRQHLGPNLATEHAEAVLRGGDREVMAVAVRRGHHWYVSLGYTLADIMRRDAGVPLPHVGHGISAEGTRTPSEAVVDFVGATASSDVQRMIELTPPDEMAALHDYGPTVSRGLQSALQTAWQGTALQVRKVDTTADVHGAHAFVRVTRLEGTLTSEDGRLRIEVGDGCPIVTVNSESREMCHGPQFPPSPTGELAGRLWRAKVGFDVVRRGGRWYVSPLATLLDDSGAVLDAITPHDLETLLWSKSPSRAVDSTTLTPTFEEESWVGSGPTTSPSSAPARGGPPTPSPRRSSGPVAPQPSTLPPPMPAGTSGSTSDRPNPPPSTTTTTTCVGYQVNGVGPKVCNR